MPRCHGCNGLGLLDVKINIMKPCPECMGAKILPDGNPCSTCNKTGEIATNKHTNSQELCTTCWGSGEISQGAVNVWFAIRIVPTTLLILGGGLLLAWVSWSWLANIVLTATILILTLGSWGVLAFTQMGQLPKFGPIGFMPWFIMRAGTVTLTILGMGSAFLWILSTVLLDARKLTIAGLTVLVVWAVLMFYLIIFDSPREPKSAPPRKAG